MNAPIIYRPIFVGDPSLVYDRLVKELDWVRHDKVPRAEYYISLHGNDYTYGSGQFARTYVSQPNHRDIQFMWMLLEMSGYTYDVCFLNKYDNASDQLGWHADDSPEMDDDRSIAIISLYPDGVGEREIWFRENADHSKLDKVRLGNGSLCLMPAGMQDTHQHRIPKADRQDAGPRISLTFRGLAPNVI